MARKKDEPKLPGVNRKAVLNALEAWKRPRVDTKDPQAIAARIEEYIKFCVENDVAPGVAACASWLGISVSTLQDWYSGRKASPEHQRVAAKLYGLLQNVWEQDMHEGTINNISGIYVGKAFYGFVDSQEIIVQHNGQNQLSVAELIAESKLLSDANTIDADYSVVGEEMDRETDPRYQRSLLRQKKTEARLAAIEANKPITKAKNKAYHKQYYQEHKVEMDAARIRNAKAAAERAQNGDYTRRKPGGPKKAQKETGTDPGQGDS